ncbi:unnamed protein product [Meganyctiphanes norvegica]|uniref:6-pyruvoyltetrahydropterin synthase n=1 Tax=Meganyctiphanes norvegica TaxID=48144 RepID=A0AAV2RKF9_MEGNR
MATNSAVSSARGGDKRPVAYVTRVEKFSACHRLHSYESINTQKNVFFEPGADPEGAKGHYNIEVTVRGPVDSTTGMVINITDLKDIINIAVMDKMDHKHLDLDVPDFRDSTLVSTTENVAVVIYEGIKGHLPSHVNLYEVKIHETDKNIVIYRGEYE